MKKIVKAYGNTLVITFNAEDQKIYDIKKGTVLDLSDVVVLKKGNDNENGSQH